MEIQPETIAAIDVGTNSIHMVIAAVNTRGMLRIISRDREMVRLGSSGRDMKYLQPDAIRRGVDTINKFTSLAKTYNSYIRAVATSAVREAENKYDFLEKVKSEAGIDVEVISGAEEGRLIYIGAINALPVYSQKALIIDIGGGSTETIIGYRGDIRYVHSAKLGTIRLTKLFFESNKQTKKLVQECRDFIKGAWAPTMSRVQESGFEIAAGTSGTIQTLVQMALAKKGLPIPDIINGLSVRTEDILDIIDDIIKAGSTKARADLPGMEAKRADIILAGALILEHIIKIQNISKLLISSYALREGIVFDTVHKRRAIAEFKHLSYLRYQSVYNLCSQFQVEIEHAEHVKNITLKIFDDLKPLHKLDFHEREMLEAASLLHDIGYYISHDQHHKHSYYIIKHSIMPGFTNDEAELIANIARYHRKSHPKKKHENYAKLTPEKQYFVRILGGILRIAEGIDRRQLKAVKDIDATVKNGEIIIRLLPNHGKPVPDIELWGAERRKALLEESIDRIVKFILEKH